MATPLDGLFPLTGARPGSVIQKFWTRQCDGEKYTSEAHELYYFYPVPSDQRIYFVTSH